MSNTRTCWMFGLTMFAVLALAACAPRELPSDTGLLIESLSTPTDARPFTPDVSPSPTKETVPSPEPSPTVAGYPYPSLTPQPTPTLAPSPTPISLPPLPTYPPLEEAIEGMSVLYSNSQTPGYRVISVKGANDRPLFPWWQSNPQATELGRPRQSSRRLSRSGYQTLYVFWKTTAPEVEAPTSIWVADTNGSNSQPLVIYTSDWVPLDPIWSPDGQSIVYLRYYLARPITEWLEFSYVELWGVDLNGENHQLISGGDHLRMVTFGGEALVFHWMRNGYIYLVNAQKELLAINPADGTYHRLMTVDDLDLYDALAPDGRHVVVSPDLSAEQIRQAGLEPVVVEGELGGWSTDGSHLLYVSSITVDHQKSARILNVETGAENSLTVPENTFKYSLSPDSQFLGYQTDDGIYIVDIETAHVTHVIIDPKDSLGRTALQFYGWFPIP